jgi:phosphoglycerate-specific signal transduction histidine kinase
MDENKKQALQAIIQDFEYLLDDLKKLLSTDDDVTPETNQKERKYSYFDNDTINELAGMGRSKTEEYLKTLKSKELGDLLRKIGASSEETKRSKDMMINKILYKIFDFNTGHSIIKGEIN